MKLFAAALLSLGSITAAAANPVTLRDYLASMDKTEVTFAGRIRFDPREREFHFYDAERNAFSVTVDAGRKVREEIETTCAEGGFMITVEKLCKIEGRGTVQIRGSQIDISIDAVESLGM